MTNLDKVRKALVVLDEFSESSFTDDVIGDIQSALSAHEQEVAELVEAIRQFLGGTAWLKSPDFERLRAALRPFTGDEK